METINASEAKRGFGDLLIRAQHAPVGINKNGKPIVVVVSAVEYEQLIMLKEDVFAAAIQEGIEDRKAGRVSDSKALFERLRGK